MQPHIEQSAATAPARHLFAEALESLRAHFDPQAGLIEVRTDTGVFHPIRESLGYAATLLAAEGAPALAQAEAILARALEAQERHPGHIHQGGFKWMDEDRGVTDLNAVQFALEQIVPLLIRYGPQLSQGLRQQLIDAVRLGAAEIERLDVGLGYTNIALLDILNTVLAGQVLGDAHLQARGSDKLDAWIAFTNRSGAVPEYNSPTYLPVDLTALAELAAHADDERVAVKARVMEERLWLHAALHYHAATAQLAGPHSRAYHNDVTGGICGVKHLLYGMLGDERLRRRSAYATQRQGGGSTRAGSVAYHLPPYIERILRSDSQRRSVAETADADAGVDLTTFMTAEYALGSASRHSHTQNDRLILYYRAPAPRDVGVLFSRYIVNEKRFGSHFHATDRSTANNLNEEGMFWGVQSENRAIALYALEPQAAPVHSLKTEVYILDGAELQGLWVNDQAVDVRAGPVALRPLDCVCVADGDTYIALRPLEPENLGYEAPILLSLRDGELVLSIYNYYQGEEKRFWEYAQLGGPFYKRNIRAGFVIEVGDRAEYGDVATFRRHVAEGTIADRMQGVEREVSYTSGARQIALRVDLRANRLVERRIDGAVYQAPMLMSPLALQSRAGMLKLGSATLACGPEPAWLVADQQGQCWAAANPTDSAVSLSLTTPVASVMCDAFGFGRVAVYGGEQVLIDVIAAERVAPLQIICPSMPCVLWNGSEVSVSSEPSAGVYCVPV
jgi:hypothetical protein